MLSGEALNLAFTLRDAVGPLVHGDGPAASAVKAASGLSDAAFDAAVAELESVGFAQRFLDDQAEPRLIVQAPLQIYLDDLENQGSDEL
jgi:hypothetical protein